MTAFTLATFNVYWLYDDLAPFARWGVRLPEGGLPRKVELLAEAITSIGGTGADVVALQEVEGPATIEPLMDRLAALGSPIAHYWCSETLDPFTGQNVAVISRFDRTIAPVTRLDQTVRPFVDDRGFERMGSLGKFLRVDLAIGDEVLTLLNAHLKSRRGGTERTRPLRTAQAQILRDLSRPRVEQGNSYSPAFTAIVGDLNDEPGTRPLDTAMGKFDTSYKLTSATERLAPDERYTFIYDAGGPEEAFNQLDHILLSRFTHERMLDAGITRTAPDASDHDIVWARIDLSLPRQ